MNESMRDSLGNSIISAVKSSQNNGTKSLHNKSTNKKMTFEEIMALKDKKNE